MRDLLPTDIPEDLSAEEYYNLGLRYRLAGWVGLAREAITRSIELEPAASRVKKARKVLRTQLPVHPVPTTAEQRNIEGFNLMESDPVQAKSIFAELMVRHPDFEWPFSNTVRMLLSEGELLKAKSITQYLLTVNPELLSALLLMTNICLTEKKPEEALLYINRALELYPDDAEFWQMKLVIKMQTGGLPPDTLPANLTPEEYYELAVEYQMTGRYLNSLRALHEAIAASKTDALASKVQKFIQTQLPKYATSEETETLFRKGLTLLGEDRKAAVDIFEQLSLDVPLFEFSFLLLATIAMSENNTKKSVQLLEHVLSLNPDLSNAKMLLISVYMAQQELEKAVELIEQCLELPQSEDDELTFDLLKARCLLYR